MKVDHYPNPLNIEVTETGSAYFDCPACKSRVYTCIDPAYRGIHNTQCDHCCTVYDVGVACGFNIEILDETGEIVYGQHEEWI